ncbi:MAG: hypothetical protein F6K08_34215 [Okeania sp. SIO1H6]|nr:hypothetical protein [Okeania sp. SIO1H6]
MKWFFAINDAAVRFELYSQMIKVAVYTANHNTSLEPFCIYDGEENDLTDWLRKNHVKIIFHRTPHYQKLQTIGGDHFTIGSGAFLRVEIPQIVATNGIEDEYVLYTDTDIIFLKDVTEDFRDINCEYFAVAPEKDYESRNTMNTGVMYMNTKKLLECHQKFNQFIRGNLRTLCKQAFDQGAHQRFFRGKWNWLDATLNWKAYWHRNEQAKIIHFHGPKPNQFEFRNTIKPKLIRLTNKFFWQNRKIWRETYNQILLREHNDIGGLKESQLRLQQMQVELDIYQVRLSQIQAKL